MLRKYVNELDTKDELRLQLTKELGKQSIFLYQRMMQIEEKAQAEQESARMEFILTREKQESERKAIEARGIADFQRIVSEGISEQTLMWKGIEATEKLVNSPNAKIIVVGNSKGDLPVIFNGN